MSNKINTTRFGEIDASEAVALPQGILGFENHKKWILVNPKDSTKIVWLQSCDDPIVALPLVSSEHLGIEPEKDKYYVLTIPPDIKEMTANLKAPVRLGKGGGQVVDQQSKGGFKKVYSIMKKMAVNVPIIPIYDDLDNMMEKEGGLTFQEAKKLGIPEVKDFNGYACLLAGDRGKEIARKTMEKHGLHVMTLTNESDHDTGVTVDCYNPGFHDCNRDRYLFYRSGRDFSCEDYWD